MLVTVLNTSIPCKIETLLCVDVRFVYIEETIQHAISDENILKMKVWDTFLQNISKVPTDQLYLVI